MATDTPFGDAPPADVSGLHQASAPQVRVSPVLASVSSRTTGVITAADQPAQSVRLPIYRQRESAGPIASTDLVTIEEPMETRLGYRVNSEAVELSLAVTMRTPGNDFDLALGFLLSEGIIRAVNDVRHVETCGPPSPDKGIVNTVKVTLADHVRFDAEALMRHFYTSSSCGVCGKTSLDAVRVQVPDVSRSAFTIPAQKLRLLPDALRAKQTEFDRTGGLHAAAAFDATGRIHRLREDVGRHNALDKLVGSYLAEDDAPLQDMGILLSGRASFELLQKAAMTCTSFVAAIGPPSSLAVEMAADQNITLVGFLKGTGFNVYVDSGQSAALGPQTS